MTALALDHSDLLGKPIWSIAGPAPAYRDHNGPPEVSMSGITRHAIRKLIPNTDYGQLHNSGKTLIKTTFQQRLVLALLKSVWDPSLSLLSTANPATLVALADFIEINTAKILSTLHGDFKDLITAYDLADSRDLSLGHTPLTWIKSRVKTPSMQNHIRLVVSKAENRGHLIPADLWPNIKLITCWLNGSSKVAAMRVPQLFGTQVTMRDLGLIASEGRLTIPLMDSALLATNPASAPLSPHDASCEFLPWDPRSDQGNAKPSDLLKPDEISQDGLYRVIISTPNGLIRYDLRDVISCDGFIGNTPLISFVQKTSEFLDLAGAKISTHQVADALAKVFRDENLPQMVCSLACSPDSSCYVILLEERDTTRYQTLLDRFVAALDKNLRHANVEYEDKRATGRLKRIEIQTVPDGFWENLFRYKMQHSRHDLMEQYKRPLILDLQKINKF